MRKALALMAVVLTLGMSVALDADAKRLGGGKSSGMQRQSVTTPAQSSGGGQASGAPAQAAPAAGATAAAAAPAAAAAAAPKRSWMGPIAGLAAGLGLAALASHLGFGEALANMLMIGLLAMAALALVGFILRKRAMGQQPAFGGAAGGMGGVLREQQPQHAAYRGEAPVQQQGSSLIGSRIGGGLGGTADVGTQAGTIPAGFDTAGFERNAKAQFLALQDANDARDLERLRDVLTPDMFEVVRADLASRGDAQQKTEVFGLQAQVLDVAQEGNRHVVSVRFTGSVRDQQGAVPEDLDEIWHLTKSRDGFDGWVIAGIQQTGA